MTEKHEMCCNSNDDDVGETESRRNSFELMLKRANEAANKRLKLRQLPKALKYNHITTSSSSSSSSSSILSHSFSFKPYSRPGNSRSLFTLKPNKMSSNKVADK